MLGLFSGELIFGGAYYWKEFCISKWVGLDNKTTSTNSPMGLYLGGLIIRRIFVSEIWGAYFREGLFWGWGGGGAYYQNFMVPQESTAQ